MLEGAGAQEGGDVEGADGYLEGEHWKEIGPAHGRPSTCTAGIAALVRGPHVATWAETEVVLAADKSWTSQHSHLAKHHTRLWQTPASGSPCTVQPLVFGLSSHALVSFGPHQKSSSMKCSNSCRGRIRRSSMAILKLLPGRVPASIRTRKRVSFIFPENARRRN